MKHKITFSDIIKDIEELYALRPRDEDDMGDAFEAVRQDTENKLVANGYSEESASDLIEDLLLLKESFDEN